MADLFEKWAKTPTVVLASQMTTDVNYGDLGALTCGEYLLQTSDGNFHALAEATFEAKYVRTLDTATLQGLDWD